MDVLQIFPTEIIFKIFGLLDLTALCLCRRLSKKWRRHVNEYLGIVRCLDFVPYESIVTEDGLKHMLSCVNNLRVLHLDSCWQSVTEENLFVIAKNCNKLSVLTASRCKGVSDAALETVARYCKQLAELDLSSCFNISDQGVLALSERCPNLRELHVSSCYGVTDKSVSALAKQSGDLTELDVSWCFSVTDQSIKEFLSSRCKLKLLRIKGCAVSMSMVLGPGRRGCSLIWGIQVTQGMVCQLMAKGIVVNNFF